MVPQVFSAAEGIEPSSPAHTLVFYHQTLPLSYRLRFPIQYNYYTTVFIVCQGKNEPFSNFFPCGNDY